MKVLALTPGPLHVSPGLRYRIEQWEPHLRRRGIELVHAPFMDAPLARVLYARGHTLSKMAGMMRAYTRQLGALSAARDVDLVYVFREATLIGPALIESVLAAGDRPVVFDLDDAIFVRYRSPSNGYWSYLKCASKTATLCRKARHVMAGNAYLAEYASRYSDTVSIVPTTIDTERYHPTHRRPRSEGSLTIGWTGSHSTAAHLSRLVPVLATLAERRPFRLVVVGAEAPSIPGVRVEARPFRAETEVEDLSDIDIGVMPLPDDAWSRGKCGLKALQYMGLGIPTVVSPVGVNTEIVADGANGLHADSDGAWLDALTRLIDSEEIRARFGSAGRETVEKHYSARAAASQVATIFESALSSAAVERSSGVDAAAASAQADGAVSQRR